MKNKKKIKPAILLTCFIITILFSACGGGDSGSSSAGDSIPPEIVSTSPANGAINLPRNSAISVTFNEDMDIESATDTANFFINDGVTNITGAITYSSQSFTVTFKPDAVLGNHQIYTAAITTGVMDKEGNNLESDFSWSFTTIEEDETPPLILSDSGTPSGADIEQEAVITIDFTESQSMMDISSFDFNTNFIVEVNGSSSPISGIFSQDRINADTVRVSFTPDELLIDSTEYSVTIGNTADNILKDASGNPLADTETELWTFTIAAQPPEIVSHFPAENAVNISRDANITVTFNEAMDETTVTDTANFKVNNGSSDIAGDIQYESATKTATFNPDSILDNEHEYTVTLTTAITDANGVAMSSEKSWDFTTSDTLGPEINSFTPAPDGVENVSRDTNITVTFNEQVDEGTIGASSIILKDDGDNTVTGSYSYASGTNTATFNPDSDLKTFTEYTVEITTAIADIHGNSMDSPVSWSFKTAKKTCRISWNANRESAVNRTGGGYRVYCSIASGFEITDPGVVEHDVPWVSGPQAPTYLDLELERDTYYFKVVAYSSLNGGSASVPSSEASIAVE